MNLIRSIMSLFLLALLGLSVSGWIWASGRSSPHIDGARFVLVICGLSSVACLWLLWRGRSVKTNSQ